MFQVVTEDGILSRHRTAVGALDSARGVIDARGETRGRIAIIATSRRWRKPRVLLIVGEPRRREEIAWTFDEAALQGCARGADGIYRNRL